MNQLELITNTHQDVNVIRIKGALDAHTAPQLENLLQNLIDENRYKMVLNLSNLTYISSAGLGVLMGFIEEIRENLGDIKFTKPIPKVYKVFHLLGFTTLFKIYSIEEEAIADF